MNKAAYEKIKKAYSTWSTWAVWNKDDLCDTSVIENSIAELKPEYIFIGLNPSRDISGGLWRNFHMGYKADKNMCALLNNSPFRGAYITDLFKDGFVGKKSGELLKEIKNNPALGVKAIKAIDKEISLLDVTSPRIFFLGLAVEETYKLCVPERLNPVPLMHPSEQNGDFLKHNQSIFKRL